MKRSKNFLIVGIDHGYGNIKTANTVTPTGITKLDAAPTFTKNTLYYDGSYYLIGEGHKEFIAEKIKDEDYYLLTLVAIAKELKDAGLTEANIILAALEAPLRCIATNAGLEGSVIVNKVKEQQAGMGFNALTEEYVDMVKEGILDPAKVTRSALQNATSVASTFLTTESAVANIKEDVPAMPAGGAGGMGMM